MNGVWVLGESGLLGSALLRQLLLKSFPIFRLAQRIRWADRSTLEADLELGVLQFSQQLNEGAEWTIYWAAGVGAMGSNTEDLSQETLALKMLLQLILKNQRLKQSPGRIVFASSAGAIYAGAHGVISESSAIAPTTPYAYAKLEQEALLTDFQGKHPAITLLLARLSTIYGPGQASGKQQGLITLIARHMIRNKLIQIYVPFDTIRDYVAVDDAAAAIMDSMQSVSGTGGCFMHIIASERPCTIAQIISTFHRIAGRAPRIAVSSSSLSHLYAKQLSFQSDHSALTSRSIRTSLAIGISRVYEYERLSYISAAGI